MEKAGLKTFFYSFVFSLFTVFGVNGVYLRVRPSGLEAKIPNKNITLFLKDLSGQPETARAIVAKKIILSTLPEIPKSPEPLVIQDNIPLNIEDYALEEEPAYQLAAETDIIPLEGKANTRPKPIIAEENAPPEPKAPEKIVGNFEEIIQKAPPVDEDEMQNDLEASPPKEIQIAMTEQPPESPSQPELKLVQATEIITNASPEPEAESVNAPQMRIPLQKDKGIIRAGNKTIEVVNSPSANQVALNAGNVPIKSMISEAPSGKIVSENGPKALWQPMTEKAPQPSKDEPWLVAKAKNPQNNLIAESEGYKKDEAEIKRILNGQNNTQTNGQPIELAAETVKNLLIPIPDDILKDQNLTPQLASSPQNKVIEEKLNTELGDDHFKDDYIDNPTPATPQSEAGKGSIINSLTSIFSSKNTPEIGNSVEDESPSGIFSSFTKKKARVRSNSKILPTEMRLSFQPNRAEISGQTLRWIRAFANKINTEKTTGLEVRIDGTSAPLLQQRRLNLLQNILIREQVDYNKVSIVFTSREPNSFIIRTVKINNKTEDVPKNYQQQTNNRYQQW